MKQRRNWELIFAIISMTVIFWGGFGWGQPAVRIIKPEPRTTLTQTSQTARYSLTELHHTLAAYPRLLPMVLAGQAPLPGQAVALANMPIMPGLAATRSRDASGTLGMSTMMTPQGVDVADQYLITSAYDHGDQYNSVLYVQDLHTNRLLKTVVLQGRPHVGGITYDADHQQLYVCGADRGTAEIITIKLKTLLAYNNRRARPSHYASRTALGTQRRASFLTYHDQTLFVGFFDASRSGDIQQYTVDRTGAIVGAGPLEHLKNQLNLVSTALFEQHTLSRIQGAVFYGGYAFLAQSYGPGPSKVYVFKENLIKETFRPQDAVMVLHMPSHLEQISAAQGRMYLVFESAAAAYRQSSRDHVDRVLSLDLATLVREVRHAQKS